MTLQEVMKQVDLLTPEERRQLAIHIIKSLPLADDSEKRHDIREFRGMAAHLRDQDAQEYVNELRNEG